MPLVAIDGSWAICMPKKTGSHTIVHHLSPTTFGDLYGPDLATVQGPWHGGFVPEEFSGLRIMIVRDPLERLASMFHYAHHTWEPVFRQLDREADGLPWCPRRWLAKLLSYDWTPDETPLDPDLSVLHEYAAPQLGLMLQFRPDEVYESVEGLLRRLGVRGPIVRRNAVTEHCRREDLPTPEQLFEGSEGLVQEWIERDSVRSMV